MPKLKKKRRHKRRDAIPFSRVRKPIPRTGNVHKNKKDYNRKQKHRKNWGDLD